MQLQVGDGGFTPITISITLETQDDLERFATIICYTPIATWLEPKDAKMYKQLKSLSYNSKIDELMKHLKEF